ncbi:Blue copper domain-containing protein [Pseudomonas coronafaciens pv. garcae]|nr:Blue copper domain-containing protein [Pseudomonas coronafaciens pv. garcae]RMS95899.1 Blue copper domain-containing protein [Pseudomonas coronafaciens pv. oryzae]RMS96973.1 Blue copper domain-containing protein [Pseudomonas coronafaciens pv. oryzae]RMV86277.1 Blue copper domain-containing protein [Pseudomonas coronafaciens pv. garcae]
MACLEIQMIRKLVAISLLSLASGQLLAAECSTTVDSTDQMMYDTKAIQIDKSCKTFTVNLTHSGNLPKNVMGHNWVLSKDADAQAITNDGMAAGIDKDYLKPGDDRIIAHTKVIGAGEKDSVKFDVSKLDAAEKYQFFCTFPGHISMMKGAVTLK